MRAVIYARYSTDMQRAASIEDQVRICAERIEGEGWTLDATYTDHARSGATRLRPGYRKLLEDARNREFDAVVAEGLDRLSRDQEDIAALYKQLGFADIKLVTLAEGEVTELHVGLKGTMNALFLKDLAAKIKRGQRGRLAAGRSPGGLSFGYRVVREFDETGEPVRGKRAIEPREATIVRRIFAEYAAGRSARRIAAGLNSDHFLSPRGGEWTASSINGNRKRRSGILYNEAYIGFLVYNRVTMVRDPETGRRISRTNQAEDWDVVEAPELRIIDQEISDQVQTMKTRYAGMPATKARRPRRLLSGLVRCGLCGGGYTIRASERLGCSAHRERGTCENHRTISSIKLERLVLAGLKERLLAPELVKAFVQEYRESLRRLRAQTVARQSAATQERADYDRKISRFIDAIENGTDTPAMHDRLKELEAKKAKWESDWVSLDIAHAKTSSAHVIDFHPNLPELYRRKVEELETALDDAETRDEAFHILRTLIEKIVVAPRANKPGLSIELHGMIASILDLANKNGTSDQNLVVSMVAEEGLEPPTHGL